MFASNVTSNSFAAEVWFHADALSDWLSIFDSYYSKALRADMAIGEEKRESGIFYPKSKQCDTEACEKHKTQ